MEATDKKNSIKNSVNVETNKGDRSFFVIHGNLLVDDGDVFVVNTYENEHGEVHGDFVTSLQTQFHINITDDRPIYHLDNGGYIGIIERQENAKQPFILVLHSKLREGDYIGKETYQNIIEGMYAALASLEMSGYAFNTVSFPVLLKKGLNQIYADAASILIKNSIAWLKKSMYTNTIRYFVYLDTNAVNGESEDKDLALWNEALNMALGRTVITPDEDDEFNKLRQYILSLINSFPRQSIIYKDTLLPLQNTLSNDNISPEIIGAFGRKLAESLCEELLGQSSQNFDENIKQLKYKTDKYDPFFIQSLYQIKSFGNTSIHRSRIKYSYPMEKEDLKILLLFIKRFLNYYQEQVISN